jgi:hypothetical protein
MTGVMAVAIGCGIGFALVAPVLWHYRREIKRSWGEALGLIPRDQSAPRQKIAVPPGVDGLRNELVTVVGSLLLCVAAVGSAAVAITSSEASTRFACVALTVLLAIAVFLWSRARLT